MKTTIDKAGRVVIPSAARQRAGLMPGVSLRVTADENGVRLERSAPGPKLVRVGRRLVAKPTAEDAPQRIDVAALVEDERNRSALTAGHGAALAARRMPAISRRASARRGAAPA